MLPAVLQTMQINYRPIGLVHTPFQEIEGMPIQPTGAAGVQGTIELLPEFAAGLKIEFHENS